MNLDIAPDAGDAARRAAAFIARSARDSGERQGQFTLALSGGETGAALFAALREQEMPWPLTWVLQVDERVAPQGHADRNLTLIENALMAPSALRPDRLLPMPVEMPDLERGATEYAEWLARLCGRPPRIDLVHLGLGADGHTASLVPGDAVLDVRDRDVALVSEYRGRRRMTLTLPVLSRSRCIVWLVTGVTKAEAFARFTTGDGSMPAGRVSRDQAHVFADRATALLSGTMEATS